MNPLERLLQDDMYRLIDRLAADAREGAVADLDGEDPDLRARIDQTEARLARLRESLLEGYRQWREAIETCEDLWALSALKAGQSSGLDAVRRAA